jgi:hypothetical protein
MSPLMQLAQGAKLAHPNVRTDAVFSAKALAAFAELIARPTERSTISGSSEQI